jgi:hypothetical protein
MLVVCRAAGQMLRSEDRWSRIVMALSNGFKSTGVVMLVCLAFGLTGCAGRSTAIAAPKPDVDDWRRLTTVERGTLMKVLTASGDVAGHFVSAEGGQITVMAGSREVSIAKSDVQQVSVRRGTTRQKIKRGFAIGALAGGLLGAFTTESNRVPFTLFLAAGWGGIGALIGVFDGIGSSSEVVIYVAHASTTFSPARTNVRVIRP